ncbi:MAG: hypothetical protein IJ418_23735 [Clostridia bacterium]|nr:hypothetical protein [Clostridia bacterium]
MKNNWSWKLAAWTFVLLLVLALIPACFETTQNLSPDGSSLLLGLPFAFYTVLVTSTGAFAVHLNIASLIADASILYLLLFFICKLVDFVKQKCRQPIS